MREGDLSNVVTPRLLVVFEGLVGLVPDDRKRAVRRWLRLHQWKRAVGLFQPDQRTVAYLWDIAIRWDFRFDIVSFLPSQVEDALTRWTDDVGLPVSNIRFYGSPERLAHALVYMPDVWAVLDPDPARHLLYGHRSRLWNGQEHPLV